jgi:hypothetical protein
MGIAGWRIGGSKIIMGKWVFYFPWQSQLDFHVVILIPPMGSSFQMIYVLCVYNKEKEHQINHG